MPVHTILLLALAGAIHSVWNLLAKRSVDKQVFFWLAVMAALGIFLVPFLLLYQPVPVIGLLIALLSGLLEAAYFLLLGSAYQRGDLSLVYPLARGSAPLFVTLVAVTLLGERLTPIGFVGIALVIAGIYTLHLRALDLRGLLAPFRALRHERASQLALLVGVVIASYSVVDKVGVHYVHPLRYIYLIYVATGAALAPYMIAARRDAIRREWRASKLAILATAIMFLASYGLVLFALTTTEVAYVSSVREMAVVFGALLGAFVLSEPFGRAKITGALLIFAGIACIGLAP